MISQRAKTALDHFDLRLRALINQGTNKIIRREKRLLIVHSAFSLWAHFNTYQIVAAFMENCDGYAVDGLICNKAVKACDFWTSSNYDIDNIQNWRKKCRQCIHFTKSRFSLFCDKLVCQDSLIDQIHIEKIKSVMASLDTEISQDEYFNLKFNGIGVGKYAYESYQYFFRLGSVEKIALIPGVAAYEFLKSSMIQTVCAQNAIENYDAILINDAGKSLWGIWADVAFTMGKNVLHCALNYLLYKPPLHYSQIIPRIYHDSYEYRLRYVQFPGVEKVRSVLGELDKHETLINFGKKILEDRFGSKINKTKDLRQLLHLNDERPVVVVFTHLCWDNSLSWGHIPVNSFEEWLSLTYNEAIHQDHVIWMFKIHPGEIRRKSHPKYNTLSHLKMLMSCRPSKNIRIIDDPKITTRDLIPLMHTGITLVGTVEYELPAYGVNCIALTKGIHSRLGFTIEAETIDEYLHLIKHVEEIPPLSKSAKNKALAYTALLHSEDLSINVESLFYRQDYNAKTIPSRKLKKFTVANMNKFKEIMIRRNL